MLTHTTTELSKYQKPDLDGESSLLRLAYGKVTAKREGKVISHGQLLERRDDKEYLLSESRIFSFFLSISNFELKFRITTVIK